MADSKSPGFSDIERDIAAELRNRPPHANATVPTTHAPSLAMPDYVEHYDGATDIGRLSAEAVVREYEAAAYDIETLGVQLIDRMKECEDMTREALAMNDDLKRAADRFRQEAKRVFQQIENCSQFTAEVRQTCADLKEKLGTQAMMERLTQPSERLRR